MFDRPNIAFFGTSYFSVRILENLEKKGLLPSLIVTAPDTPQGRNLILTPPPVKTYSMEHNIQVIQPDTLQNIPQEILSQHWDLFIVVSYGRILPRALIEIPERGTLNVHPSLLPKFRGASPIQSAILNDEKETGVTIILLDEQIDHGPIVAQASTLIEDWPPRLELLEELLADVGGKLLTETILPWLNGDITVEEQEHDKATYTEKIKKKDGLINLKDNPYQNFLKIRSFGVWPGTYFFADRGEKQVRVKIVDALYDKEKLIIKRVIPEGKKEMNYVDFKRSLD